MGDTGGLTLTGRVASAAAAIDHTDPTASAPNSYAFVTGTAIGSTITTRVRWPAGTDDLSGVGSYALRQSVNGAAWTTVTASTAALSIDRSLTFSTAYRYRVRAQDRAGNTGEYVDGPQVHPKLTQQNGTGVTYSGTWTSRSSSSASGGSTRYATKAGAWVQFSFTGRAVAVIAPKGASRGSFKAYVDGVVRRDRERLPELVAVADRAVRPELERRPAATRSSSSSPARPAIPASTSTHSGTCSSAALSCPGTSSSSRAQAAAGRGSCGPCR